MNSFDIATNYLAHHGILGQKWGIRRYQNEDGSLTPAGIKRYKKDIDRAADKAFKKGRTKNRAEVTNRFMNEWDNSESSRKVGEFDKKHGINLDSTKGPVTFPVDKRGGIDQRIYKERRKLYDAYVEEGRRISLRYKNEFAGALLRDIGREDTQRGREFVEKYYWDSWSII